MTTHMHRWAVLLPMLIQTGAASAQAKHARASEMVGDSLPEELGFVMVGVLGVVMLLMAGLVVLMAIAHWKVFEKAGQPGWACLVPIYNIVVLLRIVGRPDWWILLVFIPAVNIGVAVLLALDLTRSFGREEIFAVGLILLPFVFYPILAFSDAQYKGPAASSGPGTPYRDPQQG